MTHTASPRPRPRPGVLAVLILLTAGLAWTAACKGGGKITDPADKAAAEIAAIEAEAKAAEEEAAVKPQPKPEPKVNDAIYVEIAARSVLIREKFGEDQADQVEPEIEKVYERLGVTAADYQEFVRALTPEKTRALQKQVQDKIQALAHEYR